MKKTSHNDFGTVDAVKKIQISPERLRYWEKADIVHPKYVQCGTRKFRRYSEEDIHRAIVVKLLVDDEKYSLEGAKRKLEEDNS
ncbi:MAG: MerR family transcriptional regulator [Candidatus Omnitrophica bacterium]|nr:MerR family transcriptional regulator [Candidatus Omnitrophota bacterium]MBU1785177.1 MerR family transcriptional regulator [Candidatus Omnitrophota bacterium]MBU1851155.1 MerR family transcriptional regulator [Candidatus Omnitrophota bacterium]